MMQGKKKKERENFLTTYYIASIITSDLDIAKLSRTLSRCK